MRDWDSVGWCERVEVIGCNFCKDIEGKLNFVMNVVLEIFGDGMEIDIFEFIGSW